ncbi:hypothetical protein F2Q68_00039969 [Brassica cretica]|uniref:Zinc knuckle CX2CX4HX4C domain-containing protein n=1 Tax=Brassica cretica TaxID=69181 RepID=A0A8S9MEF3_BRACR|nr:hypothetical protein F2Q68_00039969 [Brassica cretica]
MEIELPTEDNDVMEVEFEYIKIEKNLFTCFSLFHEEVDCPRRHPNALPPKERALGITQSIALQRIEAEKRRHDDRRGYSRPEDLRVSSRGYYGSYAQRGRNNTKDRNYHIQREDHHREQSILSRTARSSSHHPRSKAPSLQYRVVDKSRASAGSSAPLQNPARQYEDSANRVVRYPQAEKDLPSENTQDDRRSALERLQEPNAVDNHPVRVSPSFESGRLQLAGLDVENDDLLEEDIEEQPLEIERVPASLWLGEGVDVSSRRGTIPISNQRKMTNKRKVAKTPIRKRVVRSPLLGLNQKKTSTVRAATATRKKLMGVCGCGYQQKKRGVDVAARGMGSVEVGVGVRREVVLRVVRRSDGESLPRSLWMRPHLTLLSVEENEHCRPSTKILSSESMAVSPAIEEELDHGDAKGRDLGEALLAEQPLSKKLEAEEEELEHEKGGRSVLVLE